MLSPNDPAVYFMCIFDYDENVCVLCISYKYIKRHKILYYE